jgi:hypothetical protein
MPCSRRVPPNSKARSWQCVFVYVRLRRLRSQQHFLRCEAATRSLHQNGVKFAPWAPDLTLVFQEVTIPDTL